MIHSELLFYLSMTMIVSGIVAFFVLLFVPSPYGRNANSAFGPPVPAKIAWLIQEIPAFLIPVYFIIELLFFKTSDSANVRDAILLLAPFIMHYFQRSLIYPMLIREGKPMPAVPFLLAFIFCIYNGYLQSSYIINYGYFHWDFISAAGYALFAAGMAGNIHSDQILRSLRKPGETGYKIPHGGLFSLVSGANFLAEIIEWTGFALLNRSLPAVAFALFTAANTAPRAWHHHLWYLKKFGDEYPKNRKAILPYLI
ncbi:hypothetical protein BOX15_Mlig017916g1 [Macrostomum lignano]|uniref:3-oxo-5alpha-steroid 4-dehydrogenase (NADP(+)) n=1 Tax=Macrostomum lignano TaxID=282301 RepID=A0A267GU70_9PLAT|nr:hypothetical protein BOX15_Mlig017916g1 [Macrostomum lignano]